MTELAVTVAEGWDGIVAALKRAVPGDTVLLKAGRYIGAETLRLTQGVTLQGSRGAILDYRGDTAAITAEDTSNVAVRSIELEGYAGLSPIPLGEAETDEQCAVGLVQMKCVRGVNIEGCIVRALAARRSCIALCLCERASVSNCNLTGARRAVAFLSSEGEIAGCECHDNLKLGIMLARYHNRCDLPSFASIRSNRCYDNAQAGIALFSSLGRGIDGNECWANATGIYLQRDPKSTDAPSVATIRANRCHDNAGVGILLSSSLSAAIEDNECWANATGIALQRDKDSADAPSDAPIRLNRCHDNSSSGIALLSSLSAGIENNDCWANASGIALVRDSDSADAPSDAPIRGNRCYSNTEVGIVLASSLSASIANNDCWANATGIALLRDADSADAPSDAPICRNRCHDNAQAGIALFSSLSTGIEGNKCWANGNGISLQTEKGCADAPSEAPVRANRCHDNSKGGIVLSSSLSAGIEDNECWANGIAGISLEAASPFSAAQPQAPIANNRCFWHTSGVGIQVLGGNAQLSQNTCFGNARDHSSSRQPSDMVAMTLRESSSPLTQVIAFVCSDRDDAEHLGGFLESGCPNCLRRFLKRSSLLAESQPPNIAPGPVTIYAVSQAEDAERLVSAVACPSARTAADALIGESRLWPTICQCNLSRR